LPCASFATGRACAGFITTFFIMMPAANMVHPSSCDIEEALDLLFLSPAYGPHSPLLNLHPGFDSDAFKDWSEANDMVASVYVALTADASNSHVSTVDNLCDV
jgi:hypothetical protein